MMNINRNMLNALEGSQVILTGLSGKEALLTPTFWILILIFGLQTMPVNGLIVHLIMMVGGASPINPEDEDKVVDMLNSGLASAKQYGVEQVSSTSFEEWMQGEPQEGDAFEAAVAQVAKVHARCYRESDLADSCVQGWHLEFLRGGEFQTLFGLSRLYRVKNHVPAWPLWVTIGLTRIST